MLHFYFMGCEIEKVFRECFCYRIHLICFGLFGQEIADIKPVQLIFFMWHWHGYYVVLDLFIPHFFILQKKEH